jgi:penicillin-binding protein 1A
VSLTELVGAYAPFANGGLAASPHVVNRIRTAEGKVLYARPRDPAARVVDANAVGMMNAMMHETLTTGTARKAEIPGWFAAGKTGTSQDFRDAWFIGYTSRLVAGVWLGNDDNSPTRKATGGGLPVEVWTRFMKAAHQNVTPAPLPGSTQPQGGFLSSLFPGAGRTPAAPPPQQTGNQGYPPPRPQVAQTSARPEADSGLDGWLVDRLFGGRR